ncbi:hypothetical protein ACUODJ_32370, partial [Escherichia sp. HC-CC]
MAQRVQLTATVSENQLGQRLDQASGVFIQTMDDARTWYIG